MSTPERDLGQRHPAADTRIVGLGASAGGLAALEQFLAHVPPASGLAYVVVQHLDPTHKAMLTELLQRVTTMPVREAADGMRLQADVVYVIAPNTELTVAAGVLHLAPPAQPRGLRLPIDLLFSSLARDQGEHAVGVVLSGMGSDGSVGLQAIKSQGGLTLVQQPESAQFDSMPRNAIATGSVDIVDLAAELPARVLQVAGGWPAAARWPQARDDDHDDGLALDGILELLRLRCKHDLSQYKASTLRRRVQRRMGVHGLASKGDYEVFVRQNPQELDLLFKEVLIGVTSFFRDPPVWQELRDTVMPALLARRAAGERLRAWVVGCSTGEEAFSLAMVFQEAVAAQPEGSRQTMQIFASDLSADAIVVARRGLYPAKIATEVGADRLARFFVPLHGNWLVGKQTREMVLFAQHDVILDPPFTRLDLLCCRNLMIYFTAALQRRLVPLFSYSLRPGGALLLGAAETVGNAPQLFTAQSPKSRLYWRSALAVHAGAMDLPTNPRRPSGRRHQETHLPPPQAVAPANLQLLAEQVLLQSFSPPAVLVNEQGDVVYIHGSIGRFLEPASGKANWNIHAMARPAIRTQIVAALRQSLQAPKPIQLHGLRLDSEAPRTLDVTVQALREPQALLGLVMIAFHEVAAPPAPRRRPRRGAGAAESVVAEDAQRLRDEVNALRQEMAASAEELQAANEELQSTNEELQSTNEELQSANEELTTSKEESQSMNEELQTLNGELQSKLDDLALAQSDMQNLLNSTDIATLFLDSELNVRRYTEQVTRLVHLRDGDVGRPLTDLAGTLLYPQLNADAQQVLRQLTPSEREVTTTDGLWFMVRIRPYRTLSNVIQGVVITFVDITVAKALEARLRKA